MELKKSTHKGLKKRKHLNNTQGRDFLMSKCCKREPAYAPVVMPRPVAPAPMADCICSLPMLVILILIVLQFSKHGKTTCCESDVEDDCDCATTHRDPVGNGILFIIALFFLACVGCGRGFAGHGAY
jgi:hypothetical protein